MDRYIGKLIISAEKRVTNFMHNQVKDVNRKDFGSLRNPIIDVKPTVYVLTTSVAVYLNKDSIYYHNPELYEVMKRALDFVSNFQREDGSFDYPSCNFKSAPDTSFCYKRLIAAYRLINKYDTENKMNELKEKYFIILCKAQEAIKNGGFHTPNHRWAICAALMQGANLLDGDPKAKEYRSRVNEYLAEGIDGDEDGQYAERSTGGYNAVVNNAMISMYEESKDEKYLGYVERNLHMMLTYVDQDDTIFTQNSTRQDQGKTEYMDIYFYQYLYMTSLKYNPEFDAAAHKIIKDSIERGLDAPDCLHILMLNDAMLRYRFKGYGFLDNYRRFYPNPGVLRVKTEKFGYTLLKNSSAFLFLKVKETPIYVKIGESYCAVRNFVPQTLEVNEKEYTMSSTVQSWYYLPFENYNGTSDWWEMDHSKRELLHNSEVGITVTITELEDGLQLKMKTDGLDRLPLRLNICVPSGSILENEHFYFQAEKGSGMILREGYLNITHNQNHIQVGPGFGTHEFPGHYSGEDKNDMGYTIYFNDYTPCEKTIVFKVLD
ncbi:hypothetical protein Ana3638_02595 [Anaerocolumna sedimenticola]|uniref:Alginate lyase domain-containing protein n=1 Tax=Anaerocolumna sedimenticola TaxID=2696063 RepID=A0A6P1TKL0_9FIRM|nr:hypothetical protein [Anaerocolumna sedimenticola]QHQ59828.1 hypothetical protein Ana3638_02595 [Anaerocolumna sedimenticola]